MPDDTNGKGPDAKTSKRTDNSAPSRRNILLAGTSLAAATAKHKMTMALCIVDGREVPDISNLDPRVFIMQNIHDEGGPILMHTRWTMSYLRGPLTRQEVRALKRL